MCGHSPKDVLMTDDRDSNHKAHKEHNARKTVDAPLSLEVERLVRETIGAGLAVHRALGPGFVEPVYQRALEIELRSRGLSYKNQCSIEIRYRGELASQHRLDLVVERAVVVEVEAVKTLRPVHHAQILSYLKASGYRV